MVVAGDFIREIDLKPIKLQLAGEGCLIVEALALPMAQEGEYL